MTDDRGCAVDPRGHARRVLEYDKVLAAVGARARTAAGRARIEALLPLDDAAGVAAEHATVTEARRALDEGFGPWSFEGVRAGVETRLQDAARADAALDAEALRDVADALDTATRLRRGLDAEPDRFPLLAARAAGLGSHAALVESIRATIDERGEVRDDASPRLRQLRRDIQAQRQALLDRLDKLMAAADASPDRYVTQRAERYVIPVRADAAGAVRGIVHDRSASGATLFIEPLDVLDANNELQRRRDAEAREVKRILAELTAAVAADAERAAASLTALAALDDVQARVLWARDAGAHAPRIGDHLVLRAARHPLLDARLRAAGGASVPLDLDTGAARVLVVTGPNTGGKTVALKTVGVLVLLSQAGIPLPAAADSELPVFARVVADIGDEQSIEAAESTFSSHLRHVLEALHAAGPRTLVLLDELMAGTDPEEGAALARVVLRRLAAAGGATLVTTHLSDLKLFAHAEPGVANAGMAFDPDSRAPLYKLQPGVPGASNAFAIAARIGMDADLLEAARHERGDAAGRLESALVALAGERDRMAAARAAAEATTAEAERMREENAAVHAQLVAKRRTVTDEARREAAALVAGAKARIEHVVRELRSGGATREAIRAAHDAVRDLERETSAPDAASADALAGRLAATPGPPRPGDPVRVRPLGRDGILEEIDAAGRARVRVGNVPVVVPASALDALGPAAAPAVPPGRGTGGYVAPEIEPVAARLDLRGFERAAALAAVESFLDRLVLQGSSQGEIVHGKGTGVLRRAVQEMLARHPDVAEFRLGEHNEGGSGVTVVKLR
jgi:DNA mismatch repair protein MutS2